MRTAPGVRVAYANAAATVYTVRWAPGARPHPLPATGRRGSPTTVVSVPAWSCSSC